MSLPAAIVEWVRGRPADRTVEYWDWFAVAAYLLLTVDLLTTLYASAALGAAAEANPFVQWALEQGLATLIAINLGALVLAALVYRRLLALHAGLDGRRARVVGWGIELWLGALIAAGLFVFANNLAVIVHGASLL